jgi:uncharacterized protein
MAQILTVSACLLSTMSYPVEGQTQDNADFDAGVAAYNANDLPLAFKDFFAAAEQGHADSQYNVALVYEKGLGVDKDEAEAVIWYAKSAAQGNAAAQFNLGVLYENGRGTPVDFAQAREWYRRASSQRDALAIGNLGELYVRGQGVQENKIAGVALLLLSATLDSTSDNNAKQNLAATRGLSADMITAAQGLVEKFKQADDILVPLDKYLKESGTDTVND